MNSSDPCGPSRHALPASNATLTKEFESQLLETFPRLPGATRAANAPIAPLRDAPTSIISSHLVAAVGWWTASGDARTALRLVTTHLPKGFTAGFTAGPTLAFNRVDTRFAADITALTTFAPYKNGVAERLDVQAIYWPPCPNVDALIPNPTGATVLVERSGKAPIRKNIDRQLTLKLVGALKKLPPALPVITHCPAELFGDMDVVTFHTSGGPVIVTENITGCPGIAFDAHPKVALSDWPGALNAAVLRILGR